MSDTIRQEKLYACGLWGRNQQQKQSNIYWCSSLTDLSDKRFRWKWWNNFCRFSSPTFQASPSQLVMREMENPECLNRGYAQTQQDGATVPPAGFGGQERGQQRTDQAEWCSTLFPLLFTRWRSSPSPESLFQRAHFLYISSVSSFPHFTHVF